MDADLRGDAAVQLSQPPLPGESKARLARKQPPQETRLTAWTADQEGGGTGQ